MFWNVEADVICDAPHGAQNYAVGVNGMKQKMPTSHEPMVFGSRIIKLLIRGHFIKLS